MRPCALFPSPSCAGAGERSAAPRCPRPCRAFLVLRLIACKLQAQRFGDLAPDLRKALLRRGRGEEIALPGSEAIRTQPRTLAVGTLLTREWAGRVQHVMVLADGFAWNGQSFGSLSEVARAITGTRWSGPAFFGLKGKANAGKANPRDAIPSKDPPGMDRPEIGGGLIRPTKGPGAALDVGGAR